jgi:glycerol-3-phosphate dehydrogenase (NAD(P)+)
MRMVAEGVKSARPLLELAAAQGVEMPIGQQVADVLDGHRTPAEAIPALMLRSAKPEFHGLQDRRGGADGRVSGEQP